MSEVIYCVYEVVNRAAHEILVGVTRHCALAELMAEHARSTPVWMSRWRAGAAEYKYVASGLTLKDARFFAANYAKSAALKTLKVHLIG